MSDSINRLLNRRRRLRATMPSPLGVPIDPHEGITDEALDLLGGKRIDLPAEPSGLSREQVLDEMDQRADLPQTLEIADRLVADHTQVSAADKLRYVAAHIDLNELRAGVDGTEAQDFLRQLADNLDAFAAAVLREDNTKRDVRIAAEVLAANLVP